MISCWVAVSNHSWMSLVSRIGMNSSSPDHTAIEIIRVALNSAITNLNHPQVMSYTSCFGNESWPLNSAGGGTMSTLSLLNCGGG